MCYALPERPTPLVRRTLAWIAGSVGKAPLVVDDRRRLEAILKENPEDLRRRQMNVPLASDELTPYHLCDKEDGHARRVYAVERSTAGKRDWYR
jgi:hypothetical protein